MTKFVAQSMSDLRTAEATLGRMERATQFIVNVECNDGSWCELDADSVTHAERLAMNWVDTLNARGASCWEVVAEGKVKRKPFFTYYEDYYQE